MGVVLSEFLFAAGLAACGKRRLLGKSRREDRRRLVYARVKQTTFHSQVGSLMPWSGLSKETGSAGWHREEADSACIHMGLERAWSNRNAICLYKA